MSNGSTLIGGGMAKKLTIPQLLIISSKKQFIYLCKLLSLGLQQNQEDRLRVQCSELEYKHLL